MAARSRLRASYHGRVLASTVAKIGGLIPGSGHAWARAVLVPIAVLVIAYLVVPNSFADIASGAVLLVLASVLGLLVIGAADFLFMAPRRLDYMAAATLEEARAQITVAVADRDAAVAELAARAAAAAVTVEVHAYADAPLRTVDVDPPAIDAWLATMREELGHPPPRADRVAAPASDQGTTREVLANKTRAGTRISDLLVERRTPEQFQAEVEAWMVTARKAAPAELLRKALESQVALVRFAARNTGPRQLSNVRVRITVPFGGARAAEPGLAPMTRFPDPPTRWGAGALFSSEGGLVMSPFKGRRTNHMRVSSSADALVIELTPVTVPSGDEEVAGVIAFGLPGDLAGSSLDFEWRVTAAEADHDAKGTGRLDLAPDPLTPAEAEAEVEAYWTRLTTDV